MSLKHKLDLGITVGTACNIRCRHCLVDKNLGIRRITKSEIELLVSAINRNKPRELIFTGGEPVLFTGEINSILSSIDRTDKIHISIITNGYFASTPALAVKTLKSFKALNSVQMSYDKFHAEFVPETCIHNLQAACRELNLSFGLVCAIQAPLDLIFLNKLKLVGVPVTTQKILPIGRAKYSALNYSYPAFEAKVLRKKCPNIGRLVYNCGRGFTICCGFLASKPGNSRYVHRTIAAHLRSRFYKLVSRHTFGELVRMAGLSKDSLSREHSAPCALCEYIVPGILSSAKKNQEVTRL
ncbi:MAG: radical SAM protein [Elusimicrobiota bacterium]